MQFNRFSISGLLLVLPAKHCDARGFFSEVYRQDIMVSNGIAPHFVQDNHVKSTSAGVLRGLHYQTPPHAQGKLVRCTRGAILDVAVDIRQGSPTFGHHIAVELSSDNWHQLWVPEGFAHGYVTLKADCEVNYKVTDYWRPECERGIAWNDPSLAIDWIIPAVDLSLSAKDRCNPTLDELEPVFLYSR